MLNTEGPIDYFTSDLVGKIHNRDRRADFCRLYSLDAVDAFLSGRTNYATICAWLAIGFHRSLLEVPA